MVEDFPTDAEIMAEAAIEGLAQLGDVLAAEGLRAAAACGSQRIPRTALAALIHRKAPYAVERSLQAIRDGSYGRRAFEGLKGSRDPRAAEAVLAVLNDCRAVLSDSPPGSRERLRDRLPRHDVGEVLPHAAAALGSMKCRQAIGPLILVLAQGPAEEEAVEALMQIDPRWRTSAEGRAALADLRAIAADDKQSNSDRFRAATFARLMGDTTVAMPPRAW